MVKYRVIAKGDMHKGPHTWHEGLDYELVENASHLLLASDQGQITLRPDEKMDLLEKFDGVQD